MNEVVPRKQLEQNAMTGIGGVGGGIALLALSSIITGSTVIGLIVAAGLAAGGYAMTKSEDDRTAGRVTLAIGAVTGVAALTGIGTGLLSLAGFGLVGLGGWSIYKFVKGIRSRQ